MGYLHIYSDQFRLCMYVCMSAEFSSSISWLGSCLCICVCIDVRLLVVGYDAQGGAFIGRFTSIESGHLGQAFGPRRFVYGTLLSFFL